MSNNLKATIALGLCVAAYFLLHLIPFGSMVLYPFQLLVTVLHEFGHALGAIITGGLVASVQINSDGSGVTYTSGGWRPIVIAGGYIGSGIFGNIIIRSGLRYGSWSKYLLGGLLAILVVIATIWSRSLSNTIICAIFAASIYWISRKSDEFMAWFLVFTGLVSVLYVIQDFRVGPSSDLQQFAQELPIMSHTMWMYAWLVAVVLMSWHNLRDLLKR